MIGIFYQKESLYDTMTVLISNESVTFVNKHQSFSVGFDENKNVCFINIFNVSEHIEIRSGFIKPEAKICRFIHKITKIKIKDFDLENKIVVGKLTKVVPIPDTHLSKCCIFTNKKEPELQIVCGAKNAREGLLTAVAKVGSVLPNGTFIKSGKLLNVISDGMLCSQKELNIDMNMTEGIIELNATYKVGESFDKVYVGY